MTEVGHITDSGEPLLLVVEMCVCVEWSLVASFYLRKGWGHLLKVGLGIDKHGHLNIFMKR